MANMAAFSTNRFQVLTILRKTVFDHIVGKRKKIYVGNKHFPKIFSTFFKTNPFISATFAIGFKLDKNESLSSDK